MLTELKFQIPLLKSETATKQGWQWAHQKRERMAAESQEGVEGGEGKGEGAKVGRDGDDRGLGPSTDGERAQRAW